MKPHGGGGAVGVKGYGAKVGSGPPAITSPGQLCLPNFIYWTSLQDFIWIKHSASKKCLKSIDPV